MARRIENRLTARQCVGASPGRHADGGGLYLDVDAEGRRRWLWRYTRGGRTREMGLGTLARVTLAQARAERDRWRAVLFEGRDPIDARAAIRESRTTSVPTFGDLADQFIADHEAGWRNPKHVAQWRMTLAVYAKPIRSKPVSEITLDDVVAILRPMWHDKRETASRLRGRIEMVLDSAAARGLLTGPNPARWKGGIKNILPAKRPAQGHHEAMPWGEVPAFVAYLRSRDEIAARALEFTILTAARSGEVRLATPDEFDLDARLWTVPADRMKANRPHRVPLSPRAVEIVRECLELGGDFVFPGRRAKSPLSDMTLTMSLRRQGSKYTAHGFRSSFRDWVGDATSFPREVAEAALAHVIGDETEAAYRRGDALEKRRLLMSSWAAYLDGPATGKVVRLHRVGLGKISTSR